MDATSSQIEQLRALVNDLSTRVASLATGSVPAAPSVVPFWSAVNASGVGLSTGFDWEPEFYREDLTDRHEFHVATATGSFEWSDSGFPFEAMFRIAWDNSGPPYQVRCYLQQGARDDGGNGLAQVKFNGVVTEYTLSGVSFVLDVKSGRNVLVLSRGYPVPDSIQFGGVLWDGRFSTWVDPR